MPTAVSSVLSFLTARKASHNGPDLIERFLRYGCDMETQMNAGAGATGEPIAGKRSTYTDGINTWWSYRIPRDANTNPTWKDYNIEFSLDEHCEGIGSTGWDWKNRVSRWLGFDFDAIVGHAEGVGISKEELDRVKQAAQALPYVELRRSTRGGGLHIYVPIDGFATANHDEHSALARSILGVMSQDAGFNFHSQGGTKIVDACGGNMWIWHRESTPQNKGLSLVKAADGFFPTDRIPTNWKEHLSVIRRQQQRVKLGGLSNSEEAIFDELTCAHRRIDLDDKHREIIDELTRVGASTVWVADHHLLQTHTVGFQKVAENPAMKINGVYQTNSRGTRLAEPNCFAFPLDDGGWKLYRFGRGANEAPTWSQDKQGYTTCTFNVPPDLKSAAHSQGAKDLKKGGFELETVEKAVEVIKLIDPKAVIEIPEHMKGRTAVVSTSRDGRLTLEIPKRPDDENLDAGKFNKSDKKNAWTQVLNVTADTSNKSEVLDYDSSIRCLQSVNFEPAGWAVKTPGADVWMKKSPASIKMILQDKGHSKLEAEVLMGRAELRPWKLVQLPFQPEYPGDRQWNLRAPQLRFQPAARNELSGDSPHPTWDLLLNHAGSDLTQYLRDLPWAQLANIRTGGDYLRSCYASWIRFPFAHTPYLYLFGGENCGKSSVHEGFDLLVTCGVVKADRILTTQSDFNSDILGAILCVVEETNVAASPKAHAKIKEMVNATKISIRKMRTDAYDIRNMTHWIHCANPIENCPMFEGDTRITMIHVPELQHEIPKEELIPALEREAPEFLRTLLDMTLPPITGRLKIPVVVTQHKRRMQRLNRTPLETFIGDNLFYVPGEVMLFSEFFAKFHEWLPADEKMNWNRTKISRNLPEKFQSGAYTGNQSYLTNASWTEKESTDKPAIVVDGRVKR